MTIDMALKQRRFFIQCGKTEADRIYDLLEIALEDEGYPLSRFERDEDTQDTEISIYLEMSDDEGIALIKDRLGSDAFGLDIHAEDIPDIDWVSHVLADLKPVRAGRFFVHGSHDRALVRQGDIAIEIEAGEAFGTGHHGTTYGCLNMIQRLLKYQTPNTVLDLGTGSGVLAIALAKVLNQPILATDIDPIATRVALENADLNGVGHLITGETSMGFAAPVLRENKPFDLIIANILAGPLMRMAPTMYSHTHSGSHLILSGILATQRNRVIAAYKTAGFAHIRTSWDDAWVTLLLKRP